MSTYLPMRPIPALNQPTPELAIDAPVIHDRHIDLDVADYEFETPAMMASFTLRELCIGDGVECESVTLKDCSVYFGKTEIVIDGVESLMRIEQWIRDELARNADFRQDIRDRVFDA